MFRYDREFLERFCKDNDITNITYENIDESVKVTRETHVKGDCKGENCHEKFDKTFRRMVENGGPYCKKCSTKNKLYKSKQTNLEKYGVENPSQSVSIKEKKKDTCMKNFGVEHSLQSEEVREKSKQTCLEKYGVEYSSQSQETRYKVKQTCLERYGVENHMQNAEMAEKASKSSYKLKDYTFPSGKVIKCQGYEPFALNILINDKITEEDIVTSKKEVPEIWYKDGDDKDHRYYVDIFIKSMNKFIEVKSTWTYKKNMEKVELTKNTIKQKGFLYECWVFDNKGNVTETIY